jgi:hypothetical protein
MRFRSLPVLSIALASALWVLCARPIQAHHSFASEFDANRPVLLQGKITRVEWINPHTWVHLEVENEDGSNEAWMVEGGTPNTMLRAGFTRDSLKAGTEIVVRGYRSRDPSCIPACRANGRDITFPDGSKVFMASPGSGRPDDQ